jgi:hypothetical protein
MEEGQCVASIQNQYAGQCEGKAMTAKPGETPICPECLGKCGYEEEPGVGVRCDNCLGTGIHPDYIANELTAAQAEIEHLHRDSERYYWSDGHVEKLHAEIAALRDHENAIEHTLALVKADRERVYQRAEAAEARAQKAEALLREIDPLRSEMQRAADQTQKDRQ